MASEVPMTRSSILRRIPFFLAAAVVLWCVGIGVRYWTTPIISNGIVIEQGPDGSQITRRVQETHSFADISALGMVPLLIPVFLACGAAVAAWHRFPEILAFVVVLFLAYSFVTGFSIGGAYVLPGLTLVGALVLELIWTFWEKRQTPAGLVDQWSEELLGGLGTWSEDIPRPPQAPETDLKDPFA
jgi:hypothetical protein